MVTLIRVANGFMGILEQERAEQLLKHILTLSEKHKTSGSMDTQEKRLLS